MGKEEVKKINNYITSVVKSQGFVKFKSTLWIRKFCDCINILSMDSHGNHFNCDVAVQPLCVPYKMNSVSLGIGARIERHER